MAKLRVTCPACQHTLGVEQGVSEPWLTCPHCLTRVTNPWQQVTATPPPAPARSQEDHITKLPAYPRSAGAEVDVEVKRDADGNGYLLCFLAIVVMLGLIVYLCGGGLLLEMRSPAHSFILLLVLVVVIAAGMIGLNSGVRSALTKFTMVLLLAICGALAFIVFLVVLCTPIFGP